MKTKRNTTKSTKTTKPGVKQQLAELQQKVQDYNFRLQIQRPDNNFQIVLNAKSADGKEGIFKISSLLATVLTAQGLGKEARLEAVPNPEGGTLFVRFYTPVPRINS